MATTGDVAGAAPGGLTAALRSPRLRVLARWAGPTAYLIALTITVLIVNDGSSARPKP